MTRPILVSSMLAALVLCLGAALDAAAITRVEPEVQPAAVAGPMPKARRASPARIANVALDAIAPGVVVKDLADASGTIGTPLQIGVGRALAPLATADAMAAKLAWERSPAGGQVAAVSITSPGAAALRAGLRIGSLPREATLRFYAPADASAFEVGAEEILATLARNLYYDEDTSEARTYWSPVVEAETLVIEIEIPAGRGTDEVRITAPVVSHLVTSGAMKFVMPKAAAACEIDAMCQQAAWSGEMNAVARIIFTRDGSSYACSGTLVADTDATSVVPYFLTANHCISTQTSASTMQSYWFYRSSTCGSDTRGAFRTLAGGATLLYAAAETDTSFLRLNAAPPDGVAYAGWIVGAPASIGDSVTGLHHPTGDLLKVSHGSVSGFYTCNGSGGGKFSCRGAGPGGATFYEVQWLAGVTEPGSSGSAVFADNGRYLLGQLYGGNGTCAAPGADFYGRFDMAFNAGLYQWLGGTPSGNTSTSAPVPEQNYSDMWWNPAESGWGLALTQHNATIFGAWYVYDAGGRPAWLVMPGGQWTSGTMFAGDLYSVTGPDPRGAFDPAQVVRTRAGSATLAFSGTDRATLSYQVQGVSGTKEIQRQSFGTPDTTPTANYTDLWWNASESGWGLSISQQYRTLFAVWYAYGSDGQPTWYVLPGGTWTSSDTYSGALYRTASAPAPFMGGAFDPAGVARIAVGTLTLRFTGPTSAVMKYVVDGMSGSKTISRQPF